MCVCTLHVCSAHGARRGHWASLELGFRWLRAIVWVLEVEPRPSGRTTSQCSKHVNHVSSPSHLKNLFYKYYKFYLFIKIYL